MVAATTSQETVTIPPPVSDMADLADVMMYEYGDAVAYSDMTNGYEMATPCSDDMYGYGEAVPDSALKRNTGSTYPNAPRRSSMKGSSSTRRQHATRRASVGMCYDTTIDGNLPGTKDPVKRRRSICFENNVSVQRVIPAVSLVEDPTALWLQDNEYDFISTKIRTLLDHVRHSDAVTIDPNGGLSINGTSYESRGLEHLLTPEISELQKTRAVDCVLQEQFMQRQVGDYDEDSLANIYKFTTVRSQREATNRAHQDAKVADQYLESTRRMFRHRRASM
jgi:hypothetical protein